MHGSPEFLREENITLVQCFYFTAPIFMSSATLATNVITCVLNVAFALCSSVGNFAIVISLWKTLPQTPENTLLGWFSFCDFLLGFFSGPAFVTFKLAEITKNFSVYCAGRFAYEFSSQIALSASFAMLTFMSVDRYLSLHFHLRYREVVTKKRLSIAILVAFLISIFITITRFWVKRRTFIYIIKSSNFVHLCIIFGVYLKILMLVRRHQTQIRRQQAHDASRMRNFESRKIFSDFARYKKYTFTVAFIIVLIVACYVPATIVTFCKEYVCTERLEHAKIMYTLMVTFIFFTTSLHPLTFIWRSRELRKAIRKIP